MLRTHQVKADDLIQLISSVRDSDFDEFEEVIHKVFVGDKEFTTHLAKYLWGVYGPQEESLDDEESSDDEEPLREPN